jgi:4-amino-4-deoxy-L-arabinose transferase-like glycosyltransferase
MRHRRILAVVLLACVSALLQFMHVRETDRSNVVRADAEKYVLYAYNLKHHHVFSYQQAFGADAPPPVKLTLPGYPYFLQHFLDDGRPDQAFVARAQLGQAALGVLSTVLAFLIACRLLPFGWAFAAGLLVATRPHLVTISGYLITEQLATTLILGSVLAALHAAAPGGRRWHALLAGLQLGLVCYVRPQLLALPWLALLAVVLVPRWRPHLKQVALACVVMAAVVLPWHLRNASLPTPPGDPDLQAVAIYHGTFPHFMYRDIPETYGAPYRFDPFQEEHSKDVRSAAAYAASLIAAEPGRYLHWYLLGKPGAFLAWSMVEGAGDIYIYDVATSPWKARPSFAALRTLHLILHWPLMLCAAVTIVLALWRPDWVAKAPHQRQAVQLVSALLAYVILLHMLGMPLPRYNLPYLALEVSLALVGVRAVVLRLRGERGQISAG